MTFKSITSPDAATDAPATSDTRRFYEALFGLDCAMDNGWVVTLEPGCAPLAQLDADDGSGMPDLTIEVEDASAVRARAQRLGADIIPTPFRRGLGPRRFFLRDPNGTLINVVEHDHAASRAA
ncbi:MAG: glyoxalase [Rhodobacteraceae bacterium]|nr:glyoxalase [Paracoccaceae bacterium]